MTDSEVGKSDGGGEVGAVAGCRPMLTACIPCTDANDVVKRLQGLIVSEVGCEGSSCRQVLDQPVVQV